MYWEGHFVGQVERTIGPHSGAQINNIFGPGGINHPDLATSDGVVTVQTNGPAVLSYAAVIDNATTDPIFVRGAADVAPVLSVGGAYATDVALGQNTCGNVTVQDKPTTVVQTPGSHSLTLTHAGSRTREPSRTTAPSRPQPESVPGGQFTITITGQFTPQGFTASVRVDQAAPACFYLVDWIGLKDDRRELLPLVHGSARLQARRTKT